MNRKSLGGLIVLNVALLFVLGLLSFAPNTAEAQLGAGRRAGDYVMVAGRVQGKQTSTLYITDLNNGTMIAVNYDQNAKALVPLGGRNVSADFGAAGEAAAGRR